MHTGWYLENIKNGHRESVSGMEKGRAKVSLEQLSKEQLKEMSLIEVSVEILQNKNQPIPFTDLFNEVCQILELSDEEKEEVLAQFYTDLNIDGRFMNVGGNTWGLKVWYPIEQIEDDIVPTVRTKKKKSKAALDDDLDYDDIVDDEDYEYDEDEDLEDDFGLEDDEELDDIDEDEDEYDEDLDDLDDDLLDDDLEDDLDVDVDDDIDDLDDIDEED